MNLLRKILGVITDFLIAGREMGLWFKKQEVRSLTTGTPFITLDFSWGKALWKGIRIQLIITALLAVSTFFGAFDEVKEWTEFGAPEAFALLGVGLVEVVRNVLKQWLEAYKQLQ